MNAPAFTAAQQTSRMINRQDKLDQLKLAVCRPGADTRVVIIEAAGGLGKTRLLYESLWRAGNPNIFPLRGAPPPDEAWNCGVIALDPLDFTEIRLHAVEDFRERLRDAANWHEGTVFPNYDAARIAYRRRRKDHVDYEAIKAATAAANKTFFEDYRELAKTYRLVWGLDTAEQLNYAGAPWLRELLTAEDLGFSTRDQLLSLLEMGQLPNTTILLAGRPSAGDYFAELKNRATKGNFTVETINLDVFELKDTRTYLEQLAKDYEAFTGQPDYDPDIAEALNAVAEAEDRVEVLHRYTGGRPVLLALFTDVLAEGKEEPEALQDTPEEAKKRIKKQSLETIQFEIEKGFIKLIFAKTGDIRSQILTALARARRGLDVSRLHYILGSKPGEAFETWRGDPGLKEEIEQALAENNPHSLRHLSFVKRGFGGRLILQDELYRIYDRRMAGDTTDCEDETRARTNLYNQLLEFAITETEQLKQERERNRKEDEDSLYWESPGRALSRTFRYLGPEEESRRSELEEQIFEAELESLHYKLRLDPDAGINDSYLDLAEQLQRAGDVTYDVLTQVEMWRFIQYDQKEEYWRAFVDLDPDRWPSLERLVAADEPTRWIKRFFFRAQYRRGVEFAGQVEKAIEGLPEQFQATLKHPFFHSELACWRAFCHTYLSQGVRNQIDTLRQVAAEVIQLLAAESLKDSQLGLKATIAQSRLRRIIGYVYNVLGYSLTTLGHYREASQAYTESLRYLHDIAFMTVQAVVRNNLSRALSELGFITRATRICRDALALRQELGYENPIAASHSTLALIYNNGLQPENAWVEAAKAVAYFRKLEDERRLGLAMHHLAEALRRLATSPKEKADSPEQLFETAGEAISEAVRLFDNQQEKMRRIEVGIEQGCLFRDQMYYLKQQPEAEQNEWMAKQIQRYRERAINTLKRALALAQELDYPRHQLDAQVDLLWTYYYAGEVKTAEESFQACLALALKLVNNDPTCLLNEKSDPPDPNKTEPYIYMLLGKAWTIKGRLCLDQFIRRQAEIKNDVQDKQARRASIHSDPVAQEGLREAARAFVLALGYNELYTVRSPYVPVVFDMLYDYLRKFNRTELTDFFNYQQHARELYRVAKIQPLDPTDTQIFLEQSFGDYLKPLPGLEEVR